MADEYKTLPVNTIFTYKGNKYKVCITALQYNTCSLCAFYHVNCDKLKPVRGYCTPHKRKDNISVHFILIKDNKDMNNFNTVAPMFATNTSLNDLHVECPKGYSIDVEHSDLSKGIIKFKNDNITYIDIEDALNLEEDRTAIAANVYNVNKLIAIDKLINISKYYNKDWKPDWNNYEESKYCISFNFESNSYSVTYRFIISNNVIYFNNERDAQAVIDNPNFRDILDAIYKD